MSLDKINLNEKNVNLTETLYCGVEKIVWILDSGCTDYIINDDYFSDSIELKNPINVKVADSRVLKGTKIGKTNTYFLVDR